MERENVRKEGIERKGRMSEKEEIKWKGRMSEKREQS